MRLYIRQKSPVKSKLLALGVLLLGGLLLSGCLEERFYHGYQIPPNAVEQVPEGASKDQVLLALGTPTTTANFGNEVYYYISQVARRPVGFARTKIIDQRVLAVYFDEEERVQQLANYGLQDGRVFDFVRRTTPTAGSDLSLVKQLLSIAGRSSDPLGGG